MGDDDRRTADSLHLWVADGIRRAIAEGEAGAGERLPASLGSTMGVDEGTVRRALEILRREGLMELRPGLGMTVAVRDVGGRRAPDEEARARSAIHR